MQGHRAQAAVFGQLGQLNATISSSFHPARNFTVKGIFTAARTASKISPNRRQIAQQSRAAIALHHFLRRATQVQIHQIESQVLDNPSRLRHRLGIAAKKLRRNRMLVLVEMQIALAY